MSYYVINACISWFPAQWLSSELYLTTASASITITVPLEREGIAFGHSQPKDNNIILFERSYWKEVKFH